MKSEPSGQQEETRSSALPSSVIGGKQSLCRVSTRRGIVTALLPCVVTLLAGGVTIGMTQAVSEAPMHPTGYRQSRSLRASLCFVPPSGFGLRAGASQRTNGRCALSLFMQSRGKKGRGGRGGKKTFKPRVPEKDEDEEITTYVSCPKCMSDSFIKAEVLGESKKLKCNNCDKSFNATAADLKDINDVYQASPSSSTPEGGGGGFTEESFFEMFGDKKSFQPPP